MEVGLLMVFQNFMDRISDREAYERDIHLAGLAEPLGFDTLGAVEHHFHNYAMLCDNMQQRSKQTAAKHTLSWSTIAVFPFESFSLIFVLGRVRMMGILFLLPLSKKCKV